MTRHDLLRYLLIAPSIPGGLSTLARWNLVISLSCVSSWNCLPYSSLMTHEYLSMSKYMNRYSFKDFKGPLCTFMEKAMATHSSTLAWKIPRVEEPGRLQSLGSLGVGHNWATSLSLFPFVHWRRKWQPTPVFLPGESQGRGSLVGCRLWGRTESDTTEAT